MQIPPASCFLSSWTFRKGTTIIVTFCCFDHEGGAVNEVLVLVVGYRCIILILLPPFVSSLVTLTTWRNSSIVQKNVDSDP